MQDLEPRRLLAVTAVQAFDDVAPVVGAFRTPTVTNDSRLEIALITPHPNALADATVWRNDGSGQAVQQVENTNTDAAGVARFSTPLLADGEYLMRARAGLYAKYFFICEPGLAEFEAEGTLSFRVDTSRPVPLVTSPLSGPTNSRDPLPFVVNFRELVQGFEAPDALVTNGTIQRMVANSPTQFTFFVQPTSAGEVSLRIPAGVATDAASNPNTASNRLGITFDPAGPAINSVVRQPASSGVTNADSLTFRVTFSEPVANLDASDFRAVGTTATVTSVVQVFARGYDLTISGGDLVGLNGPVKLELTPGQDITDLAGTPLSTQPPAIDQRYFLDNIRPTVRLGAGVSGVTNASSIPITLRFSEAVRGFFLSDVVLSNATASNFAGSGNTYTFNIAPQADGRVTVGIPAGAALDAAGNRSFAALPLTIWSDRTGPAAVVSSNSANPTNSSAIPFQVTFPQAVTGFTAADPVIANGTITGFTGSGRTYGFQVVPTADGLVTVRVPAGVAQDAAGNDNTASAAVSILSDRTRPGSVLSTAVSSPTNSGSVFVRLRFSEPVTGLTLSDIGVTNGTASSLAGSGNAYSFRVAPLADGLVTVRLPPGTVQDAAGNPNTAAAPISYRSDRTGPTTTISTAATSPTNAAELPFRITFSEAVTGFTAADLRVDNGAVTRFVGSGSTYFIRVAPTSDGLVTVRVSGGVANDAAGNGNRFAAPVSVRSDRTAPTTTISTPANSPTNAAEIPFRITFSEAVTGFTAADVRVDNGTVKRFVGSGSTYFIRVAPTSDGLVTVRVPGGVANDVAGNDNRFAAPLSVLSDRTAPTTTISTAATSPTNANEIPFRITFSEAVTGFTAADLRVDNGAVTRFVGSGATYFIRVTPASDGLVTVRVPGGVANDASGNGNRFAAPLSVLSDRTAPAATISSTANSPTNVVLIPFRITFSEPVIGFTAADLGIANGTINSFTGSGSVYDIEVSPTADGLVTVWTPGQVAEDAAGNGNFAAAPLSVRSDRTAPAVEVSSQSPSPTNAEVIAFNIVFSEPVSGLTASDLEVVNGSVSSFVPAGDGRNFVVNVAPAGDGEVRLTVPAGSARDAAGNDNTAGTFAVTSDRTAPQVTLTYNPPPPMSQVLGTVTIQFTEAVSGLDVSDLTLSFAELTFDLTDSMLSGSAATYVLDLSSLPNVSFSYDLLLTALGSGIGDLAGNSLITDASTTWIGGGGVV